MKWTTPRGAFFVAVVVADLTMASGSAPASAASTRTVISTYSPWSSSGALSSSVHVTKAVSGSCWTSSIAVDARDAYRCASGRYIFDPCFAASHQHGIVACAQSPWSDVVMIHLSAALPYVTSRPRNPSLVWALQLANEVRCVVGTGTGVTVAATTLDYFCSPGDGWSSAPDRTRRHWTVMFAATNHAASLNRVSVLAAWY